MAGLLHQDLAASCLLLLEYHPRKQGLSVPQHLIDPDAKGTLTIDLGGFGLADVVVKRQPVLPLCL